MNKQITFCNNQKCFHAKIISEENRNRKVFVRTTSVEGFSFEGFIQKNKVHGKWYSSIKLSSIIKNFLKLKILKLNKLNIF